jgi:hypothetical protein
MQLTTRVVFGILIPLLWPLLLTIYFFLRNRSSIPSRAKFIVASISAGYLALYVGWILSSTIMYGLVADEVGRDIEGLLMVRSVVVSWAAWGIMLALPLLTVRFTARRFS